MSAAQKEDLPHLPDGEFLPPMAMNCGEQQARESILKSFGGERVMTIGRVAILTQNHNGRAACHYCGHCERGCVTLSYFSSVNATLPAAQKTGKLTLRPVQRREVSCTTRRRDRARGVRVIDANTKEALEFEAQARLPLRVRHRIGSACCSTPGRAAFPTGSRTPAIRWDAT